MSTPATVPIFDPQGTLRDVPYDSMVAAVKSGGMPAVRFQDPTGKTRFVPANRTQDAYQAGGKPLPLEDQDIQHPGFWSTLVDDAKGMVTSLPHALATALPSGDPNVIAQQMQDRSQGALSIAQNSDAEKQAGRGLPYRATSVAAQA